MASRTARRSPRHPDQVGKDTASTTEPEVLNIHAVIELEQRTRRERSGLERFTDAVAAAAGSSWFIVLHIAWFAAWIVVNTRLGPFDPYPFNLLTLAVSLEAIVLTSFVLMSQDRMTKLADRRAHLDLQVNLLAEQELTAILKVVSLVADKIGVDAVQSDPRIRQLLHHTDVRRLASELDQELAISKGGTSTDKSG